MTVYSIKNMADRIATYLERGSGELTLAAYLKLEIQGMKLQRAPGEAELHYEPLKATLRYWRELPQVRGIPNVTKVEPEKLLPALGYLMILDFEPDGEDLRYTLYGSKIALVSGFDMTGKKVSEIESSSAIKIFFTATYMAARDLRCPIYSVHMAPHFITASYWHRLILPMAEDGEVKRFLVCNLPIQNDRLV